MGEAVSKLVSERNDTKIVAGIDINPNSVSGFPVYQSIKEFPDKADVIVDFSHHSSLSSLLDYAVSTSTPIVVCTTGHTDEELELMKKASEKIAVFFSGNMSIGINLLMELCKKASETLGIAFDVEIIEKHHNKKLDAPSGTALMLAQGLVEERESSTLVFGRCGQAKREKGEIGIHALRLGDVVGEHEVIIDTGTETLSLKHTAHSRALFARGAVEAAAFIVGKEPGKYTMTELIRQQ